jgi:DNA polymerase II large subunit
MAFPTCDDDYKAYLEHLKTEMEKCLEIAKKARAKGIDPSKEVEIQIASDMASRVEGLVGPKGIAEEIRKREEELKSREKVAFSIAKDIATGKISFGESELEKRLEQAVRTGVAILTEGVLVAPTEGISKVKIEKNPDNTSYLSIYYTGPIRSAGGTTAALSVLIGDYIRREVGLKNFRPTESEVERYVEEVNLYEARAAHLQYKPPDDHIRLIVNNCPVCIHGEPTEDVEIQVHRDLPRMGTNRVRGGIALVICEGIALKAAKVLKYAKTFNLDWEWLKNIIKVKETKEKVEIKPDSTYLSGVVAGRPIFSYPMAKGGFRLRYGKSRTNSLMAKNIHPATMYLLDEFIAVGTHVKLERPGKGAVLTACDSIEPPIVKLKNGDVVRVESVALAREIGKDVEEILFLGDMLVNVGDFLKANHPLMPCGWCEEWWEKECEEKKVPKKINNAKDAFAHAKTYDIPLHPKYTYFWHDVTKEDIVSLVDSINKNGVWDEKNNVLTIKNIPKKDKRTLECLCVPHKYREGNVIIEGEEAHAFLLSLGWDGRRCNLAEGKDVMEMINKSAGVKIKKKAPIYIGARMGRPEKAMERKMDDVHVLFPTGQLKERSLMKLFKVALDGTKNGKKNIEVEVGSFKCPKCSRILHHPFCQKCNCNAIQLRYCTSCKRWLPPNINEHCGKPTIWAGKVQLNIVKLFEHLRERFLFLPTDLRGVKGLINSKKIPERIEKGIFRAKHDVYVFKDGTCRFDSTDVPITHFKPAEIHTPIEKLKEMGYEKDAFGKELESEEQVVQLKAQDVILPRRAVDYFYRVGHFIDDILVNLYGMEPFYNFKKPEDVIGHLFIGLSPHTSGAVLCRAIGWVDAACGFAHPYFHTAKRRNCDGDEDSLMLLLDALINFSRHYLSDGRGGTMDAPITLTTMLSPKEVDDEVFNIELVWDYPLEFYRKAEVFSSPYDVKLKIVENVLETKEQFSSFTFTHDTARIDEGPKRTTYVKLKSIPEKVERQLTLQKKIRAVDTKDAARKLILSHFIPDTYGNLRSFSRQVFRCTNCNAKYRRVPLAGKCTRCGGNLTLTIHKGGIEKYLDISIRIAEEYELEPYLIQRLKMVKKEISEIFEDEKVKQLGIEAFI